MQNSLQALLLKYVNNQINTTHLNKYKHKILPPTHQTTTATTTKKILFTSNCFSLNCPIMSKSQRVCQKSKARPAKDNKIKVSILTKDKFQNRYNKIVSRNTHFSRGKKVGATEPPELPPVLGDGRLGLRCPVASHLPPPRSCHSPRNQHIHLRVEAFMCQRALKRHYRQNVAEVEQYVDANCYFSISILIWLFLSRCHATGCGFITTQQVRTTILHCGTYLRIILQTCGNVQIFYHFIKGSSEQASSISWTEKGFSSYFSAIVYLYIFFFN